MSWRRKKESFKDFQMLNRLRFQTLGATCLKAGKRFCKGRKSCRGFWERVKVKEALNVICWNRDRGWPSVLPYMWKAIIKAIFKLIENKYGASFNLNKSNLSLKLASVRLFWGVLCFSLDENVMEGITWRHTTFGGT